MRFYAIPSNELNEWRYVIIQNVPMFIVLYVEIILYVCAFFLFVLGSIENALFHGMPLPCAPMNWAPSH